MNVYDSMYVSLSSATVRIIASLIYSSTSQLAIRTMDVGRQSNSSDCGVLDIAFAYDVCSGIDLCKRKYDHKSIRSHLAKCLVDCNLSSSPVLGERRSVEVKHIQTVDLHCSRGSRR